MSWIIRKLTTKPVWWWERKRSYPIRSQHDRLPALNVTDGKQRFVVLTTPDALNDALWSAWSWYRFLNSYGFSLQLAVDGTLGAAEAESAKRLFPGLVIFDVNSLFTKLCEGQPSLRSFLAGHPVAKQVGLVLALSREASLLYADHDVAAFNSPTELLSLVRQEIPCYFLDDENGCHDRAFAERVNGMNLEYIRRLNAGFLYIPHNSISLDLAERILAGWKPTPFAYYTPQTVMSTLMRSIDAQPLPAERYVISNRRQFYWEDDVDYRRIAARHFTGTVRHVMYKYGMPFILQQSRKQHSSVTVREASPSS